MLAILSMMRYFSSAFPERSDLKSFDALGVTAVENSYLFCAQEHTWDGAILEVIKVFMAQ
jgi:hypothetical protein